MMRSGLLSAFVLAAVLAGAPLAQAQSRLGVTWQGRPGGGVVVRGVERNSPAESLGLQPGDVVVTINGQLMVRGTQATEAVITSGGQVNLLVRKADGRYEQYDVVVSERPRYQLRPPN